MSVIAFTSSRQQGNARHPAHLARILGAKRVPSNLATAKQVHGTRIQVVSKLSKARRYPGVDGFLTDVPGQPLGIYTADCASIFLSAPSQGLVGLLHAGWRGVRSGILPKALRLMRKRWHCPSRAVRVWLGPSIGPCCFEVQWDVARHFPKTRLRVKARSGGQARKWVVDLEGELRGQARRLGVRYIAHPAGCTRHTSRYHSFRRDKTDERQISVIMRKP